MEHRVSPPIWATLCIQDDLFKKIRPEFKNPLHPSLIFFWPPTYFPTYTCFIDNEEEPVYKTKRIVFKVKDRPFRGNRMKRGRSRQ